VNTIEMDVDEDWTRNVIKMPTISPASGFPRTVLNAFELFK